jgi:hypothetical protein
VPMLEGVVRRSVLTNGAAIAPKTNKIVVSMAVPVMVFQNCRHKKPDSVVALSGFFKRYTQA